jgi:asparagine synthase (glutamine-hydrolysing)
MKYAGIADILPHKLRSILASSVIKLLPGYSEERSTPAKAARILTALASAKNTRYLNLISRFPEEHKHSVYGTEFQAFTIRNTQRHFDELYSRCTAADSAEKASEIDILTYLPGDILTKVDIASMANSLEVRSPFMNHQLVEFAASLKFTYKQKGNTRKRILTDTFSKLIPPALKERPKMGFGVPIAHWIRGTWKEIFTSNLLDGNAVKDGYFNRTAVESMLNRHIQQKNDNSYPLWAMLIFEIWLSEHR